jgi:IclR family acetate operon transcriptional repressor
VTAAGQPVLSRAFRVLGAFAATRPEMTLAQLVHETGMPRSTVHRLAHQLESLGALEPTQRGWRIGVRMFEFGQLVATQQGLRELALPYMNDLYETTHETIQLAVLDGGEVLYVEVLSGHRKVRSPSRRGGRMPAHCTALGKVLLTFGEVTVPLEGPPFERRTGNTITDRRALARALEDVRRAGIAFDAEESLVGLCCVAAPVFGPKRHDVAAISVAMPARAELTPTRVAPAVRIAARALSRDLRGIRYLRGQ